jgi:hypothetical protein
MEPLHKIMMSHDDAGIKFIGAYLVFKIVGYVSLASSTCLYVYPMGNIYAGVGMSVALNSEPGNRPDDYVSCTLT